MFLEGIFPNFTVIMCFVSNKMICLCWFWHDCSTDTSLGKKERHANVWSLTQRHPLASRNKEWKDRLVRIESIITSGGSENLNSLHPLHLLPVSYSYHSSPQVCSLICGHTSRGPCGKFSEKAAVHTLPVIPLEPSQDSRRIPKI